MIQRVTLVTPKLTLQKFFNLSEIQLLRSCAQTHFEMSHHHRVTPMNKDKGKSEKSDGHLRSHPISFA
jgi:hypothetical protein